MAASTQGPVTRLIKAASHGDAHASDELLPLVYEELRRLAHQQMARETPGLTLQPTALVHEAYMRLLADDDVSWTGRGHFFAAAAIAMRRILVERARRHRAEKHGGHGLRLSLDQIDEPSDGEPPAELIVALDVALDKLAQLDQRLSQIVMLRTFAGLTIDQTGQALALSPATVKRDWHFARTWLYSEMTRDD